ncbi:MAG: ATP-dependent dethiobiotin synthetase BioD, partial [Luteibaculum sp.]
SMELNDFSLPETNNNLVIEGAGGCAVPLNDHVTYGHLIKKWDCKTFLVVKNYLGSINHTLLSLAYMKSLNIDIAGIIISGATNPNSERSYEIHGQVPIVARVPWANKLTRSFVQEQSELLKEKLERFIEV